MAGISAQEKKNKWIFITANGLFGTLRKRFGKVDGDQAEAWRLALDLAETKRKSEYLEIIQKNLTGISYNKTNEVILKKWWNVLIKQKEDQYFAALLVVNASPPNEREISAIDIPPQFNISGNMVDTYVDPGDAVNLATLDEITTILKNVIKHKKLVTVARVMIELTRYAAGFGIYTAFNELKRAGFHAFDNRMIKEQSVPCVLAGVPLRHVREIEVARSGKVLKFRATGSVFLANQEGGEDAIRIEGILVRSEIILILALWGIFYVGQGRIEEAVIDQTPVDQLATMRAKNVDITTYNKTTEKPAYTHHYTVPFVSRHIIIPNVYIETLSFEEKLEFGKDVIGYSILLRTYRKPSGFEMYSEDGKDYVAPKGNKRLNMYKVIEFSLNMAWRIHNSLGWIIDEREWKIRGDNAGSDDVYYYFDPIDIASSATLGLAGMVGLV